MAAVRISTSSSDICFVTEVLSAGPSDIRKIAAFCGPVRAVCVADSAMAYLACRGPLLLRRAGTFDRQSKRIALVQGEEDLGIAISPHRVDNVGFSSI